MQIGKTIAAQHEFAGGAACLQCCGNVEEAALVTVDLVAETAPQSLARMIEPLLRFAHPVEQLAPDCTRAVVHVPSKIGNVRDNKFCRCARSRGAQVGHEIDFTISDFVADLRAPTPSAAAEVIVPDVVDLQRQVDSCTRALGRQLLNRARDAQQRLDHAREILQRCLAHKIDGYKRGLHHIMRALQVRSPVRELTMRHNRFADLHRRLIACPGRLLENARHRFRHIEEILRVLGPEATLRRGYSITTNERGKIIRTIAGVRPQMKIRTRVSDGEFSSEVS